VLLNPEINLGFKPGLIYIALAPTFRISLVKLNLILSAILRMAAILILVLSVGKDHQWWSFPTIKTGEFANSLVLNL